MRVYPFALAVSMYLFASSSFCQGPTVKAVYFVDPDGERCLNCSDQIEANLVLSAVRARTEVNIGGWLRQSAYPENERNRQDFLLFPISETYKHLFSDWPYLSGVSFRFGDVELLYLMKRCRLFDCYKYFLELRSSDGSVRWHRRAPDIRLPVYPLLTDHGIMFVAWKENGTYLTLLDPQNGKTRAEYRLPGEGVEFDAYNPLSTYPFFKDTFVVLQGCRVEDEIHRIPDGILVLQLETR